MPTQLMSHLHPTHAHHLHDQQATQQNLTEQTDPELARLHRDGACPFVAAAQKAKGALY